jgi:malate dehydrogenase
VVSKANDAEKKLLEAAYKGLQDNIAKGIDFANNPPPPAQK